MSFVFRAVSAVLPTVLLLAGLAYFVVTDKYILKLHKRVMLLSLILITTLIASDIMDYYLTNINPIRTLRLLNCAYSYIAFPSLTVLFYYFVAGKKRFLSAWIMVGVNTAVYVTSLFTPIAYGINSNGDFVRGPLGFTCHIICGLLLINLLRLTYREYKNRPKYILVPLFCLLILFGAMLMDTALPGSDSSTISYIVISIVICCALFYIWMHRQLADKYEEELLHQQRLKIMVSQIQPHFLYNTIATFKALCKSDPDKAALVAEKFGQYLRENLESLSKAELIPIKEELKHTRVYAEIEMVRFENIRVEYDITDTDFYMPALSIQPIVENAIRHGVRIREEGIVRVSTRLNDGCHEVVISDNGIGFDVSKADDGEGTHIGINNVHERIEKLCVGTMTIESVPGEGTTVTFRIPQTEMKK